VGKTHRSRHVRYHPTSITYTVLRFAVLDHCKAG
jgi:hypothetical protein